MPAFPIVDTHLHLWDPARLRYAWLAGVPRLNRRHSVDEFRAAAGEVPVGKMVFVECGCDRALSTSGNHRNVRIIAGQRVGHVIDPRTGRPVAGPLISTSVVAPTCAESSALATGLFVLGAEAGEALVQREGIAALFLSEKGGRIAAQESPAFTRLTTAPAQTR
ncbi:MAG: FAD:protein FMN transferase [Opitutaceae bacterium]